MLGNESLHKRLVYTGPNLRTNRRMIPCTICIRTQYGSDSLSVCLHISSKTNPKLTYGTPLAANRTLNRTAIRTQNHPVDGPAPK
jgi:hypothetical protein